MRVGVNSMENRESLLSNADTIGGVAAMITGLVEGNALLKTHVLQWLTNTSGEYGGLGLDTRRAVIATLATSQGNSPAILAMFRLT